MHNETQDIGFYRASHIAELLCISKSTWWLWVKEKRVQPGIKVSAGVTVWPRREIHQLFKDIESQRNTN